jgi:hypothetical protein
VIGVYGVNSSAGAAYVFAASGTAWSQQAKLTASDATAADYFGYSAASSGSTGVVSAGGKNSDKGAAYAFVNV